MPRSSWTVVKFNDENSVEAVPTSWINNNQCYWPPFQRDKVISAIRKNEEADIHWPLYKVTIFRNSTYQNYMMAREKCKRAEDTSELNSEISAGEEKTKRKIKRRKFSSSEDDECCSYRFLPTPPLLKDNYEAKENKIANQEIAEVTHANNMFSKSHLEESFQYSPSLIVRKSNPLKSPNIKKAKSIKDNYEAKENEIAHQEIAEVTRANNMFAKSHLEESFQHSPSLIVKKSNPLKSLNMKKTQPIKGKLVAVQQDFEDNFVESEESNLTDMKCTCQLCPVHVEMQNKNEIYFKEIIRQQSYFKAQLWQTSEDIRDLKNIGLNQALYDTQRQESVFCSFTLPLETEQQLEEVEQFLKNQTNFEKSVTQASRTGGKHSYEFVKRNLSQLLSNKLAEKYSWFGRKHKKKFHELKLAEMLIAAGEACNTLFTRKDIEESTQKWLRRAKERSDANEKKLLSRTRE